MPGGLLPLPLVACGGLLVLFCAVNAVKRFTAGEPARPFDTDLDAAPAPGATERGVE